MLHAHGLTSEVVVFEMWYNEGRGDAFAMTFKNGVVHLDNAKCNIMTFAWKKHVRIYRHQNGGYNRLRAVFDDGSVYAFDSKAAVAGWAAHVQGRDDYMLFID